MENIKVTDTEFNAFVKAYIKAREEDRTTFYFEENEYLTDFAKYYIEYIGNALKTKINERKKIQIYKRNIRTIKNK